VVATTETAGAGIMSILAMAAPIIAAIAAVFLLIIVFVLGRKIWNKFRKYNTDAPIETKSE